MTTTEKAKAQETHHNEKNRDTNSNDVKQINVKDEETAEPTRTSQGRKASPSYTIKSMANNIQKFIDLKMVTDEEGEQLKELHKTLTQRWISQQFQF